jgi:hypothetical protein
LPLDIPDGDAEILVLVEREAKSVAPPMTIRQFSSWLKSQQRPHRSAEDFARQIAEERAAWGDES